MKRRLLIVAVFLLAGAVVNVAVAWVCVIWSMRPPAYTLEGAGTAVGPWPAAVPSEWPSKPSVRMTKTSFGAAGLSGFDRDLELKYLQWSLRAGLPFHSLYLVRNRTEEADPRFPRGPNNYVTPDLGRPTSLREGIQIPPSLYRRWSKSELWGRNLPTMPFWPGFAVNTIFYAATLWLLICGPFTLRRIRRVRRGLCPACGYDLRYGEHDACPECGRLAAAR